MRKTTKKVLAILVVIAMLATMLPMMVLAQEIPIEEGEIEASAQPELGALVEDIVFEFETEFASVDGPITWTWTDEGNQEPQGAEERFGPERVYTAEFTLVAVATHIFDLDENTGVTEGKVLTVNIADAIVTHDQIESQDSVTVTIEFPETDALTPIEGGEIEVTSPPVLGGVVEETIFTFLGATVLDGDVVWTYDDDGPKPAEDNFGPDRVYTAAFTLLADFDFIFNLDTADILLTVDVVDAEVTHDIAEMQDRVDVTIEFPVTAVAIIHLVTFNSQGGTVVLAQNVQDGEFVSRPSNPTRANYNFIGWFTALTGGNLFEFATTPITGPIVLYALWQFVGGDGGGFVPPPPGPGPTPTPDPTPPPPDPIVDEEIVIDAEDIEDLIDDGDDLVIEEDGITITIPNDILDELFDPENPEPITVTVVVTPAENLDDDGNMVIAEDGEMLVIEVAVAVGDNELTNLPGAITITVSLEDFDLEDVNTYRLVAIDEDGELIGGSFNRVTGQFQFETNVVGTFTVFYVENLRNLSIPLNSFEITDRAGNVTNQVMDVMPMLVEGRILLPIRFVAYALGAEVDWAPETADRPLTVSLTLNGQSLTFGIGEMTPSLVALGMDVPAQLQNARTMVPLRFIAEFFGAAVKWNAQLGQAEIQFIPSE
jgi:uncharacterized repeat protein (TIGR02543 family)